MEIKKYANGIKMINRFKFTVFTLVELLVVIAIIAILASLLLSALRKAKELSLRVYCNGTLKQFAVSFNCYLNDYHGSFIPYYVSSSGKVWGDIFVDNGYATYSMFKCPSLHNKQSHPQDRPSSSYGLAFTGYGYNSNHLA